MKTVRIAIASFITLLALSGITAFPLRTEAQYLMSIGSMFPDVIADWITAVFISVTLTPDIVLYGTDWLAFAHLVIALFFIPVYMDPVKYKVNLLIAMVACAGVFFVAFICGAIRGIPFFHQLIDCSFGFIGFLLLLFIYKRINLLEPHHPIVYESIH